MGFAPRLDCSCLSSLSTGARLVWVTRLENPGRGRVRMIRVGAQVVEREHGQGKPRLLQGDGGWYRVRQRVQHREHPARQEEE